MICHKMFIASIGFKNKNHPQEKNDLPLYTRWPILILISIMACLHFHQCQRQTKHSTPSSNAKKMPSHRLSINSNKQNTQCLALPALCHEAWPRAQHPYFYWRILPEKGIQKLKNWECSEFGNLQLLAMRERISENRQISIFGFQCEAKCAWIIKDLYFTLVYIHIWLNRSRDDRHFFDIFLGIIITLAA
jgi:hypothetical protein